MAKILFVYSTIDGHTLEICERLGQIVERAGHDAVLTELSADSVPQLVDYDRVVIGASIRYGKHRPEVARFINDNVATLTAMPNAFFSVNAVARKPEQLLQTRTWLCVRSSRANTGRWVLYVLRRCTHFIGLQRVA